MKNSGCKLDYLNGPGEKTVVEILAPAPRRPYTGINREVRSTGTHKNFDPGGLTLDCKVLNESSGECPICPLVIKFGKQASSKERR